MTNTVLYKTSMRGFWIAIVLVAVAFLVFHSWWVRAPLLVVAFMFARESFLRYEAWRSQRDSSQDES